MVIQKLTRSIKNRYLLFIITILIVIITVVVILQQSISLQNSNANSIKIAGNHSLLSHRIVHLISVIDDRQVSTDYRNAVSELKETISLFEDSQKDLQQHHENGRSNVTVDSILLAAATYENVIVTSSKTISNSTDLRVIHKAVQEINAVEIPYFKLLDSLSNQYLNTAIDNIKRLKNTVYLLAVITILILLGELLFVLIPALKQLFKKSTELLQSNNELAISENRLKTSMLEQIKLKTDLEAKESINKIFIKQAPTAIAMLDTNMCYMAVSQRWITDYKMEGQEIIGRSHYDVFPEIGEDWKEKNQKCLQGAIDVCDEAPFLRADGSVQWIYWDVRPWYVSEGKIGGLLMHTGDITLAKEKREKNLRIQKILQQTNEVARIGTWDLDLLHSTVSWSKMVCEIHEVSEGYEPDLETSINFYKEGKSRDLVRNAVNAAIEDGIPFDLEVELTTAKGATIWTRSIGHAQMAGDTCIRLFGMVQDINDIKRSELALNKAHKELKAIFNSEVIAIVSANADGIITHFNKGAEFLTGYSASEMIGKRRPSFYHLQDELDTFRIDIANLYNKNPEGLSAQLELSKHNAYDTREWTYVRKDGSTIPVQLTLTSIKNQDDDVIGYLGVSTDISEKKIAQNELLKKNHLLNFAEEITMIGHWQWDTIADHVVWSNNLYKMFELDEKTIDLTFNSYFNFVHPDDKEIVTEYFQKAAENKTFYSFIHRIVTTTGKIKTVQLLGKVFTNDKGEVIEMIGTGQDITQHRMAENKFRDLLESAPDAMVIINEKGTIQLINKEAETLFGYTSLELLEESAEILLPGRFVPYFKKYLGNYYGNPQIKAIGVEKESFTKHKDGKEIPVQISLSPIETEEGLFVSAAIRDITVQKLAENDLLRKNQLLNFAEEITMMGNWQWDLTTNAIKWSANLYKIFGVEAHTTITTDTYFNFVLPEDREQLNSSIQQALSGKLFNKLVHRIQSKDGTVKTIQLLAVVNTTNAGEAVQMIGTCQDITQQRMAEHKVIRAKENLEVLTEHLTGQNQQLADFAHISSHNLRSPVSNLNALLHLYKISESEEERTELFEKFEMVISHLTSTLNTLIEALKTKKECEKELEILDFNEVLNKTKDIISQKIIETNAILTSNFSKIPKIKYDKTYLESIFLNLVTNALKYRSPDRTPEIHIKTEVFDGKIKLTFRDNGLGIDLKKHGHKLFGLNKTFHRHPEAKGVGLYLTKIQVESMGGTIYATSEVDKGSAFMVIFNETTNEEPL